MKANKILMALLMGLSLAACSGQPSGETLPKEFLYEPMRRAMEENLLKIWKGKVQIVFSQLKESDAAILGASALAWEL